MWEQAKLDVESDLRNPVFVRKIWDRAYDFKQQVENAVIAAD
jgi:hypothetical protein